MADDVGEFFMGALTGGVLNIVTGVVVGFIFGKVIASGGLQSGRARAFRR